MKVSRKGIELIKRHEGFKLYAYDANPPRKDMTIGYGHKLKAGESFPRGITKAHADTLLRQDLIMAERRIKNAITVTMTQNQFDAVASLAFNLTYGSWKLAAARFNRGESAESIFSRYVYGGNAKLAGLVTRRAAETRLYTTGLV